MGNNRNKALIIELLPAPVRPIIPNDYPVDISNETLFRATLCPYDI